LTIQDRVVSAQPLNVTLIVAVAKNGVIGNDGGLPWRLSSDLKIFRRLTMGKPMIMGRRTFQSLGKPLDGRDNIVVTRDRDFAAAGADVVGDLEAAMTLAREKAAERRVDEIMVIGGADIYRQVQPLATRVYLTEVDARPEGDTKLPPFDPSVWREVAREPILRGPKDEYDAQLVTLERP
jgi:dihydrofolate reductase